jgi:hypothetical protein
MALTIDEVLDAWLPGMCRACSAALPRPGEQCLSCGELPAVTRPEAADRLTAEPDALAVAEAEMIRAEAEELRKRMRARFLDADRVERASRLERARDAAETELAEARKTEKATAGTLNTAAAAARDAAAEYAEVEQAHLQAARDEEAARRLRKGPQQEIETRLKLDAATVVLQRYQGRRDSLAAAHEQAKAGLAAASARVRSCEQALAAASRAVGNPGYIPRSKETISADLMFQVMSGDLDGADMAQASVITVLLAGITTAAEEIRRGERARLARQEEEDRRKRTALAPNGSGMLTAAPPRPDTVLPGGRVNPAPQVRPSPAGVTSSPFGGIPSAASAAAPGSGLGPAPSVSKALRPGSPVDDGIWGITKLGR